MKKRLGIFVFFGEKGGIDGCTLYLAGEVKKYVSDLAIICNGAVGDKDRAMLEEITGQFFVRENTGYDCGAFKDALENFIGWEKVDGYEELLLINDSCFGPLHSLDSVFDAMEGRDLDFWGLTEHMPARRNNYSKQMYPPYHIQSYFLVIRAKMLRSAEFRKFWAELELSDSYVETVDNYELRFTPYFQGF